MPFARLVLRIELAGRASYSIRPIGDCGGDPRGQEPLVPGGRAGGNSWPRPNLLPLRKPRTRTPQPVPSELVAPLTGDRAVLMLLKHGDYKEKYRQGDGTLDRSRPMRPSRTRPVVPNGASNDLCGRCSTPPTSRERRRGRSPSPRRRGISVGPGRTPRAGMGIPIPLPNLTIHRDGRRVGQVRPVEGQGGDERPQNPPCPCPRRPEGPIHELHRVTPPTFLHFLASTRCHRPRQHFPRGSENPPTNP